MSSKDRNSFGRAFQTFNKVGHQKFRLVAALISVNAWRHAQRALLHLQSFCKPCLNHYIRSALCDLLKWLIMPHLSAAEKKGPQQSRPTLETTFSCTRRFEFGIDSNDSDGVDGEAPLRQAATFEQSVPQIRQVL